MAITDKVTQYHDLLEDAWDAAEDKGATIPANKNLQNLTAAIESITAGGGGVAVSSISVTISSSVFIGTSYPLTADLTLSDGSTVSGYSDADVITWTTSDASVVEIQYETNTTSGLKTAKAVAKASGNATITATIDSITNSVSVVSTSSVFALLKASIDDGTYATKYPAGTEIADTWTDTATGTEYNIPMVVMDYQTVTLADGTSKTGAILMRKYAMPFTTQFDAAEPNNSDSNISSYGYNRYSQSGVHKWLNATATKGNWWTASTATDVAPDIATTKDGYLKGCTDGLLSFIKEVQIKIKTNSVTDGSVTDTVNAKFFLPSVEEMFGDPTASGGAGAGVEVFQQYWDYEKTKTGLSTRSNSANNGRIIYDTSGSARTCWLRSARVTYSITVWYVSASGSISYGGYAFNSRYVAPACVIA